MKPTKLNQLVVIRILQKTSSPKSSLNLLLKSQLKKLQKRRESSQLKFKQSKSNQINSKLN